MIIGLGVDTARWLGLPIAAPAGTGCVLVCSGDGRVDADLHTIAPAASALACNAVRIRAHIPVRCQRRNSPYTVCHGPYRSGMSRHGHPVRILHRIPSMSWRFVHFGGRPAFFPRGSNVSNRAHCASVRSARPGTATLGTRSPVFRFVLVD